MTNLRLFHLFLFSLSIPCIAQPGEDLHFLSIQRDLKRCVASFPDSAKCVTDLAIHIPSEENLLNALRFDSFARGEISFLLSQRYSSLFNKKEAEYYANLAFDHGKRDLEYAEYRISMALGLGEEEYTKWLDWGLAQYPENPNLLNQKAIQYLRKNEYTVADLMFRKAVANSGEYSRSLIGPWVELCNPINADDARVWAQSLLASTAGKNDRFYTLIQTGRWYDELWSDPRTAIQYYSEAIALADDDRFTDSISINGLSLEAGLYRGLCYWRLGDRTLATSDWICAVMYEYDENPEMIQLFDRLQLVDPYDTDLMMLRWMYRQNMHHFTPETNVNWVLDNIHLYEKKAATHPLGHVIQAYCANAYLISGRCKKAKSIMSRMASEPPNFFSHTILRKLENCK